LRDGAVFLHEQLFCIAFSANLSNHSFPKASPAPQNHVFSFFFILPAAPHKDNTIHGPIRREPQHDAGGIFVKDRSFGLVDYVEKMAQSRVPGAGWGQSWFGGFFFCLFLFVFVY